MESAIVAKRAKVQKGIDKKELAALSFRPLAGELSQCRFEWIIPRVHKRRKSPSLRKSVCPVCEFLKTKLEFILQLRKLLFSDDDMTYLFKAVSGVTAFCFFFVIIMCNV